MKKDVRVTEYTDGKLVERDDAVVIEKKLEIRLNGSTGFTISVSPADLEAFAYGFLVTSCFITAPGEVERIEVHGDCLDIELKERIQAVDVISLGSGGGRMAELDPHREPFKEKVLPQFEGLPPLFDEFNRKSSVFAATGGTHSAAITDGKVIFHFAEDIGRHNAIDKVIGKALVADRDFSTCYLILSGRISGEMIRKCFNAGIGTIISRAAPTSTALEFAQKKNMTVIGFLRGTRFNHYN